MIGERRNMQNKAIKKTELVIKALEYAHKHELDINDRNHVKKILESISYGAINNEDVEEFMKLLQHADTFMEMTASKKRAEEKKLSN